MIRVLHFSDVHVQEALSSLPVSELMTKRLLAAGNLVAHRGRLFRNALDKLDALVAFARDNGVDAVICTGDYTALGSEAEYVRARAAIDAFAKAPLGFATVPGNHDLYLADAVRHLRFERHFGEFLHSHLPEYAADGPYPFVRLVGSELAIVGVNSAKPNPNPFLSSGRVPDAQLSALERVLDDERLGGRFVLVMTHYGVLRRDGRPDTARHGLDNADALLRICARARVALVHGHIHWRYAHPATASRPWLFCAGSATYRGREGFWVYELEGDVMRAIPGAFANGRYVLERTEGLTVAS